MADKKIESTAHETHDRSLVSYTLGIISIVMAFFTPLGGLIFGIIGLAQSKKSNDSLGRKSRNLNILGIILSLIILVASIIIMVFYAKQNPLALAGTAGTFPAA